MLWVVRKSRQYTSGRRHGSRFGCLSLVGSALVTLKNYLRRQGNTENAQKALTLALHRFEKVLLMISLESVLIIGIVVLFAIGAIIRQVIRQQQAKAEKDGAVIDTVKSMLTAMQALSDNLTDLNSLGKDQHSALMFKMHELSRLTLDVERRLTDQELATRETIRDLNRGDHSNRGTKIYNTNSDGGQSNQGGSVHGEQR